MRSQDLLSRSRKLIEQRNFAFVVTVLMLLSNVLLSWKVLVERDRVILVPQNNLQKQIVFDGKQICKTYLVDWSFSVLSDLFTVSRHTVDRKNKLFLEISSNAEILKDVLKKNALRIKQDGVSTVFYPKKFAIDRSAKKVLVQGTFMAFFGRDKSPVVQTKTYALGWRESGKGCVLVESLEEVANEDL
ncbi:MAG: TraE/TraK family type IV conjugative transfer system protein [Pseudomonadota bacterium]